MLKRNFGLSAVALACAATAHAQSSVTLSGVMDVTVQHFKAQGIGSVTAVGTGSLSSSKLVFSGVEDLGGGLTGLFWLEGAVNADNGTGRPSNTNNQASGASAALGGAQGLAFDRRSTVGIAGPWGEVRLGRDFVPTHLNNVGFDAFNGVGVARAGNYVFSGVAGGPLFTTISASNSVEYLLPGNLAGVYGQVMVAAGENPTDTATEDDGKVWGARVGWKNGAFDVAAAVTHTGYVKAAALGAYTNQNIGASYNLGFVRLFGLYNRAKVEVLSGDIRKDTWQLGAHIPTGAVGRIRVSYGQLNDRSTAGLVNANGSPRSGNDSAMWGIGYVYDFSKRTALYGTYAHLSNKGQATYVASGGLAAAAGRSASALEVGLRHSF